MHGKEGKIDFGSKFKCDGVEENPACLSLAFGPSVMGDAGTRLGRVVGGVGVEEFSAEFPFGGRHEEADPVEEVDFPHELVSVGEA
jgi:hypothetical protein